MKENASSPTGTSTAAGTPAVAADARGLDRPVTRLPGVGTKTAKALANLGIETVDDLLHHLPRRYLHRGKVTSLSELREGEHVAISARVLSADLRQMRQRRGVLLTVKVTDGQRTLDLTFFGRHAGALSYHQRTLLPGTVHFFSGTVGSYRGSLQLTHPEFEPAEEVDEADFLRPVPVYPASASATTWMLTRLIRAALAETLATTPSALDVLPADYRTEHGLLTGAQALQAIHQPKDDEDVRRARLTLAHEEAFVLQTALAQRRHASREQIARPRPPQPGGLRDAFDARLPFELTPGQITVTKTIDKDLGSPVPMLRLLQGDVGAGKTVVALRAMLRVVDNGGQAVLLAPTEVLAYQHQRSIESLLGPLGQGGMLTGAADLDSPATRVVALTGSLGARKRREVLAEIASGSAGIVVGTHALFSEQVMFDDLGLVVVDEQHRFGVEQREVLRAKGETTPHLLHMTATPIPRTVAMTVFGDLDITELDGLPGGRTPTQTVLVDSRNERWMSRVWERAAEEVASGGRVFVVAPRIEKTEDDAARTGVNNGTPGRDGDGTTGRAGMEGAGAQNVVARTWQQDGAGRGIPDHDGAEPSGAARGATGPRATSRSGADDVAPYTARDGASYATDDGALFDAEPPAEDRVLATVEDTVAELAANPALASIQVAALHGRMSSEEKDAAMASFIAGDTPILVATTVIEVGVDVPAASLMVILDADRFGLAQLHQLRGRVGRGERPAVCLAVAPGNISATSVARLEAFASTTDGFKLADMDLSLRSEGDVLGAEQSGRRSSLRMLNVQRDVAIIEDARTAARALISSDPELAKHQDLAGAVARRVRDDVAQFLSAS